MVEMVLSNGSTQDVSNAFAFLLSNASVVATDIQLTPSQDENALPSKVELEMVLHNMDTKMDVCVKTKEFAWGFSGTGPRDLLETLRMAGVTPEILNDDEILGDCDTTRKRHFSVVNSDGVMEEI